MVGGGHERSSIRQPPGTLRNPFRHGCVDAAVCAIAEHALAVAAPAPERWGVGDGDAFAVVLTCGGTIEVLIREVGAEVPLGRLATDIAAGVQVVLVAPVVRAHENLVDTSTAVCVLTRDTRFDVPVLALALRSRAAYAGVMGSRPTHEDRLERLRTAGAIEMGFARLHSPIGLDLGGRPRRDRRVDLG